MVHFSAVGNTGYSHQKLESDKPGFRSQLALMSCPLTLTSFQMSNGDMDCVNQKNALNINHLKIPFMLWLRNSRRRRPECQA